ncbi:hypothetical protein V6N13_114987 [Hibiscus sabdariffa]
MICGESCLVLKLVQSGAKFILMHLMLCSIGNMKLCLLTPVEVPAAAQWKFIRYICMHCFFYESANPVTLRERCWREGTFQVLSAKGYPTDSASYCEPNIFSQKLPVIMHRIQRLIFGNNL